MRGEQIDMIKKSNPQVGRMDETHASVLGSIRPGEVKTERMIAAQQPVACRRLSAWNAWMEPE